MDTRTAYAQEQVVAIVEEIPFLARFGGSDLCLSQQSHDPYPYPQGAFFMGSL
ncbi:Uncharacterised protein [Bordetella bronchiseptica]|nr:Uncharacterised protein [Bordetella bronchiseptica]